jgi:HlyD family secretion protein
MFAPLRQHPVIAIIALLIIALLAWGFWPQPVMVEAVAVKSLPMAVSVEEEGRTRVIDRYIVSAPVECRHRSTA